MLGAQNLIFLGLNFVTISFDSSSVKMFSIFFFHFSERKKFGPSFPFFPLVFLSNIFIAGVSIRVQLFLSVVRCSMEMWCPDDIGRDSWDWVGPPA